jgi:hypothetical protein
MRLKKIAQLGGYLAGGIGGTVLASFLFTACGGGDDSSSNAPTDGSVTSDGTVDGAKSDSGSSGKDASDSSTDGPVGSETGSSEASAGDAGDGGSDGAIPDAAPDVVDAAVDAPPLSDFFHAIDRTVCDRLMTCCLATPAQWSDGGFGVGCFATVDDPSVGGYFKVAIFADSVDSGRIDYNPATAAACLQAMGALNCGTVESSVVNANVATCLSATKGTLDVDAGPCTTSLECKAGYCKHDTTGSRCTPLVAQGQVCADVINSTDCSYLGRGTPALQCDDPGDGGSPTCQPLLPTGTGVGCVQGQQCQSLDCNSPDCVTQFLFSDPSNHDPNSGICAGFEVQDGG